ncbi:MAG: sulfurtransferase [Silanimonas sp.]|nr:MAG: sulfurtransferase [Silanimonas sp.]
MAAPADPEPAPLIDVARLRARLDEPELRLLDARFDLADPEAGLRAFLAGHLPGARYVHLERELSGHGRPASEGRHPLPAPDAFAATLARLGITLATPVVVYDAAGGALAAARAWWLLRWMGHLRVQVLDGGWQAWCAAGGPVVSGPEPAVVAEAGTPHWRPGSLPVLGAAAVAALPPGQVLVDARAPERYRGEVEPIDSRAGHIPGALNRPFAENLEAGRFKSPERLRAEWSALLPAGAQPVLYCGSGVTACHNALALVLAGFPAPALFPPSWSGWIADPVHPVAKGV